MCECELTLLIVAWTNESTHRHTGVGIRKVETADTSTDVATVERPVFEVN